MKKRAPWIICIALVPLIAGLALVSKWIPNQNNPQEPDLKKLIANIAHDFEFSEIAELNLACARGFAKTEDASEAIALIEKMSVQIRHETDRHFYRFKRNPVDFENSEGFFRMLMLSVVLSEDFQVQYASNKIASAETATSNDGFFADPETVFIYGLLGPKRIGTCSSLPVLQVAIGRRLGYPLKLVTTKGHLFVRWEDSNERFNIEAAGDGVNRFSDDYYRQWPFKISPEEEKAEGYLKSLTPPEELAVFLSIRGMCLREARRYPEAAEAFSAATKLAPNCRSYHTMLTDLRRKLVAQN